MSNNTPVKSEKPEASLVAKPLEVEKVLHSLQQHKEAPSHKARLHELFALIDKEFDALYEENQECMYINVTPGITITHNCYIIECS